jgi:glycosyltransferase involved in cell wall biosynthesis
MTARVLYINHVSQIGGAEVSLLALLGALDRAEFDPVALCPPRGELPARLAQIGVPVHPAWPPRARRGIAAAARQLVRGPLFSRWLNERLREWEIDLVHTNSFSAQLAAGAAAQEAGLPVVWHMHSILKRRWPNGVALRRAGHNADRVICVSRAVARELEAWGIPASKLTVIYNGLDLVECFRPQPPTRLLHTQYGLPADAQLVAIIGQVTPGKGQDVFIRAAASIAADHPRAVFLIVGAPLFGDQRWPRSLQRLAAELGLGDRVIFTGVRHDIPRVLAEVEFMVHASVAADSLPSVLIEAGAMAKPAIATMSGGAPEIIEDRRSGLLVPAGDAEAMAAAMDRLLSDAETAAAMGAAARSRIGRMFTIEENVRKVQQLYRAVLEDVVQRTRLDVEENE